MEKFKYVLFASTLIVTFALPTSTGGVQAEPTSLVDSPARVYIPSIGLLSDVEGMGIDEKGNMDVPSAQTDNVGWYKYGVKPGEKGTAVVDAHNTAAFKELHKLIPGSSIYVITEKGRLLRFTVQKAKSHSMAVLTPQELFEDTTTKQINLITCAGISLSGQDSTHRLIVTAVLS